jgi:hypothetical protein
MNNVAVKQKVIIEAMITFFPIFKVSPPFSKAILHPSIAVEALICLLKQSSSALSPARALLCVVVRRLEGRGEKFRARRVIRLTVEKRSIR